MRKWIARFQSMTLDKKIKLFLIMGIIVSASVVLMISTVSSIASIRRKSQGLVKTNVETVSKSLDSAVSSYYNIALSLIPDESIQLYLKEDSDKSGFGAAKEDNLNTLMRVLYQQPDMNFIGLYKSEKSYIYRGQPITKSHFNQEYEGDLKQSIPWGKGELAFSYGNAYFGDEDYTISFYQPVYDMNKIGKKIGNLCFNVREDAFSFLKHQTVGDLEFDIYLIDRKGHVLFCEDKGLLGKGLNLSHAIGNSRGDFSESGKLYAYQRVADSDLYVMGTISNIALMKDSVITMTFLFATVLIIVAITVFIVSKVVKQFYKPMEKLVSKMEQVSEGNLDVRINEAHSGQDFVTISKGFNHMMDEINTLLDQVKLEQHQIEQIRFNALQSQIKPHFLYNALDCIHWQAAAEGNKEISTFVKALANYYRACLSRGKDVITLGEELEHIKSYLIIQNIRYEDILEARYCIDKKYYCVKIPKMTLQPLIENTIYHGMKTESGKKGMVILSVREEKDTIILSLMDNGQGMSPEDVEEMNRSISEYDENFGYGVRNVNKRIELLFGEQYGLYYQINDEGGITVDIRLPKD